MSSPMTGSLRSAKRLAQYGCEAMKTGMQLTSAQPASRTCSTYHLDALHQGRRTVADADDANPQRLTVLHGALPHCADARITVSVPPIFLRSRVDAGARA